jgi:hypothetical protein
MIMPVKKHVQCSTVLAVRDNLSVIDASLAEVVNRPTLAFDDPVYMVEPALKYRKVNNGKC